MTTKDDPIIVYTSFADDGTVRHSLHPILDSEPNSEGPLFDNRVVWTMNAIYRISCRDAEALRNGYEFCQLSRLGRPTLDDACAPDDPTGANYLLAGEEKRRRKK